MMTTVRRIAISGLVMLAIALAGAAVRYQWSARTTPDIPYLQPAGAEQLTLRFFKDPAPAPAFTVRTLDGRTLTSHDLRGKVTLVNFWATWCAPCRAEIPDLVALQDRYRDHLQIIGISEDEGPIESVRRFAAEQAINYSLAMTTPELQRAFPGVRGLPTTFVLDREGRVVQKHVGLLNAATTERETRALAGLPVDATVELVDPDQPVGLANAAQAKEIPGIDLAGVSPETRVEILQRLNAEPCTCGCELTVAKCRIDDPGCGVSLPLARRIAAETAR